MDALALGTASSSARPQVKSAALSRTNSTSSPHSRKVHTPARATNGLASGPTSSPAHSSRAHRYHHASCRSATSAVLPGSTLSHSTTHQLDYSPTTTSSYLQDKLQRERKLGSERLTAQPVDDSGLPLELSSFQSSPTRTRTTEDSQAMSSGGDASKSKGLGIREIEQAVSSLHKQNFDLKLELFHRRERQAALETQIETLELAKRQSDNVNEQLVSDLDKRDKAVEEAVAMIVKLELRVEQLERERTMVRHIETTIEPSHDDYGASNDQFVARQAYGGPDVLNRMPSFLSEMSGTATNLRNVYLGFRDSSSHLPRSREGSPEGGRGDSVNLHRPSLSVLSESSFLSVYGQNCEDSSPSEPAPYSTVSLRGSGAAQSPFGSFDASRQVMQKAHVPEQRYQNQMPGRSLPPPHSAWPDQVTPASISARTSCTQPQIQVAQVGQQALQPPFGVGQESKDSLQGQLSRPIKLDSNADRSQMLPPTPDTVSTSTLRRYEGCRDSPNREDGAASTQCRSDASRSLSVHKFQNGDDSHVPRASAHSDVGAAQEVTSDGQPLIPPEHDPTDWDMESSGGGDLAVPRSTFSADDDCWIQESLNAGASNYLNPQCSVSQAGASRATGRISPDLFSFPSTSGGWATNAMFGALRGGGYQGYSNTTGTSCLTTPSWAAPGMSASIPVAKPESTPSSTSARRSTTLVPPRPRPSLHTAAKSHSTVVSSSHDVSPSGSYSRSHTNPWNSPSQSTRPRSNSIGFRPPSPAYVEAGHQHNRASTVPPKQFQVPPPQDLSRVAEDRLLAQRTRHYPPPSQGARSRAFSIFRRSTEHAHPPEPKKVAVRHTQRASLVGVPSWAKRHETIDDEESRATPPPILRRKAVREEPQDEESGGVSIDHPVGERSDETILGVSGLSGYSSDGAAREVQAKADSPARRKWLGLGRVSSLRGR